MCDYGKITVNKKDKGKENYCNEKKKHPGIIPKGDMMIESHTDSPVSVSGDSESYLKYQSIICSCSTDNEHETV